MGEKPLPKKVELQHDFDRLVSKKLISVYQLLIPEGSPTMEEPVPGTTFV